MSRRQYNVEHIVPLHCVKKAWSFSGTHFPAFGLNTEFYSLNLCCQSECAKIRTRKTANTNTFCAVLFTIFYSVTKKKQEHSISMLGKKKLSHNRTSQKKQKTVWRYWQITWCTLAPYVLNSVNELDANLKWSDKNIFYPMQDQQIMNSILINILLNFHCFN